MLTRTALDRAFGRDRRKAKFIAAFLCKVLDSREWPISTVNLLNLHSGLHQLIAAGLLPAGVPNGTCILLSLLGAKASFCCGPLFLALEPAP
jgi:hypothetical protein